MTEQEKKKGIAPIYWLFAVSAVVMAVVPCLFCNTCSDCDEEPKLSQAELYYVLPKPPEGGPPVDHKLEIAKFIGEDSDKVLEQGKKVYDKACALCHGNMGQGLLPNARKFISDPFMNEVYGKNKKSDPYTMFDSVSNGYNNGAMPAQKQLSPDDRYAVVHYIREAFVKTKNPSQYVAVDEAYLNETEFAVTVEVLEEDTGPHPATIPVKIPVYAVLDETSAQTAVAIMASEKWLDSLQLTQFDQRLHSSVRALRAYAGTDLGNNVYAMVRDGQKTAVDLQQVLLQPEVAAISSEFNTLSVDDFAQLHAVLKSHKVH